jgi:hypothetical protein
LEQIFHAKVIRLPGVRDIFDNDLQVLKDGEHTGAKPGQGVCGSSWNRPQG